MREYTKKKRPYDDLMWLEDDNFVLPKEHHRRMPAGLFVLVALFLSALGIIAVFFPGLVDKLFGL